MQSLRHWSLGRVLLVSGGWVLLSILTPLAWLLFQFNDAFISSGSSGIGAVAFGFNVLMLAIPTVPPVIVMVAWLIARGF